MLKNNLKTVEIVQSGHPASQYENDISSYTHQGGETFS
jgi:hypothetical protein